MLSFSEFSQRHCERVNQALISRFNEADQFEPRLLDAMKYSLLSSGKRVRPLLVYASALAVDQCTELTDTAACAIESIHAYSLIHDDLPAMDDDDLRRGQATCHIMFDEATAILAGDALQAIAFEWLSAPLAISEGEGIHSQKLLGKQLQSVQILAHASGCMGMVAGQAIDLAAINQTLTIEQLSKMHSLKTGALISASVQLGALSSRDVNEFQLDALKKYAQAIGLAFQVQDDILDVTAQTSILGKRQGADNANNKPTFVSLLGLERAQDKAHALYNEAVCALSDFGDSADHLRDLATYIIKRKF
ncbi:MAG: geranylgeranyl diphosphate synthase type II [Pseudohongiellaceae bacterium]|jgi:geranylgeranyl diphosphate synthase type II